MSLTIDPVRVRIAAKQDIGRTLSTTAGPVGSCEE
jgi:hypothetical protein